MDLFWRSAPLVRILIPLLLGLIASLRFANYSVYKTAWLFLLLAVLVLLASLNRVWKQMGKNHYFGILSSILFFVAGVALGYRASGGSASLPHGMSYLAIAETTPVEKENSYAVNLEVFNVQLDTQTYQSCQVRIIAYFDKTGFNGSIIPGKSIRFTGFFSNPDQRLYPDQFNYGRYLRNNGVSGTVYIPAGSYVLVEGDHFSFKGQLNKIRGDLIESLNEDSIPSKEHGVISALLVGDRSFLDPKLRDDFADAGAVHILAVSGLHVGIIYLLFLSVLNFLLREKLRLLKFFLVLALLWGYAAFTGFSPSVLRAATMFSFIAAGKYNSRYVNTYNMIAASALFLLAINPLLITQIGFQLSYLAVIGIVFFHPKFHALLVINNKYLDKLWSLVCVSFAAQLATFPLSIYYFHQFPLLFMITNIVVIPLATLILYFGVAWVIFLWIPYVSDILGWFTTMFTRILNTFVEMINTIPFAKMDGLYMSSVSVLLTYMIIILVTAFLTKPSRRILRFLALTVVCLLGLVLHRRIAVIIQDEILFPTLSESPTVIRLIQDEMVVYSEDTARFNGTWQRELYPYLLTQGFRDPEKVRFIDIDQESEFLSVRKSKSPSNKQHILWSLGKEEIRTKSEEDGEEMISTSSSSLLQLKSEDLTHFSIGLPPLQK
ncbi:MAG: competence protein ComEC [Flavobacteriales bacterium]|jgi:competence protein ComEC